MVRKSKIESIRLQKFKLENILANEKSLNNNRLINFICKFRLQKLKLRLQKSSFPFSFPKSKLDFILEEKSDLTINILQKFSFPFSFPKFKLRFQNISN